MRKLRSKARHPIQPLVEVAGGVIRFKANKIVSFLLDAGPFDMNQLGAMEFSQEDREQFAQLIGYSLSGFLEFPYVSNRTYEAAAAQRVHAERRQAGKKALTVLLLAILALPFARAEDSSSAKLPDAPTPSLTSGASVVAGRPRVAGPVQREGFFHSHLNRSLVAAEFTTRFLDAVSTEQAIHDSCRCIVEKGEPAFIARTPAVQFAFSLTEAAGVTYAAGKLWQHGHRRLARTVLMLDIVGDGTRGAANNWREMATRGKGGVGW